MDFVITTPRQPGIVPQKLLDYGTAWAWFETEYPVLVAAIRLAATAGWDDYTRQLPSALEEYFDRRGHRHDCLAAQHTALAAAQRREDRHGQAYAHYGLGRVFHWFGRFEEARTHLEQALNLFQELNEPVNTVHAHIDLSHILEHQNRFTDALRHAQLALSLPRATDNRRAQARALYFVGWHHALLGDYRQALEFCERALTLNREVGDRRGEGHTLNGIGYAHHGLGQYEQAIAYYQKKLALRSELTDSYSQAVTYTFLGDSYHAAGHDNAARDAWQRALDILENFGNHDVGHVRPEQLHAKLHDLDSITPGAQIPNEQ